MSSLFPLNIIIRLPAGQDIKFKYFSTVYYVHLTILGHEKISRLEHIIIINLSPHRLTILVPIEQFKTPNYIFGLIATRGKCILKLTLWTLTSNNLIFQFLDTNQPDILII